MSYIGFSNYSNKFHAKLFCRKYKHCAPIITNNDSVIIYQFVNINKIVKIPIHKKDLKTLKKHGWKLIKYPIDTEHILETHCLTCVQFTKKACGIKDIKIQTPFALFKYLKEK